MKVIVELSSPEELLRFFETMDPKKSQIEAMAPAAQNIEHQKPEVLPEAPAPAAAPTAVAPEPAPAPAVKAPSFDEVTKAAIKLMDAGKQPQLRALLQKYGVQALPELRNDPVKLAEFYADLEVA